MGGETSANGIDPATTRNRLRRDGRRHQGGRADRRVLLPQEGQSLMTSSDFRSLLLSFYIAMLEKIYLNIRIVKLVYYGYPLEHKVMAVFDRWLFFKVTFVL